MIRARLFVLLAASAILAISFIGALLAIYLLVCFAAWQIFYIPTADIAQVFRLCVSLGLVIGIAYSFTTEAKRLAEYFDKQQKAERNE